MAEDIPFNREDAAVAGQVEQLSPLVRRLLCDNPGPFTFKGTVTYVVGTGRVAIIDPGPDDPRHIAAVLEAVKGETVEAILVTHTHRDHSPGVAALVAMTGAIVVGCGPHRAARALALGEINALDASADLDFRPDEQMASGDAISGPGWTLAALETPGHTMNHLAFTLSEEATLFSGDHVMAWSTSIVAPPDGSMAAYMASLELLKGRAETLYRPGHGGVVKEPNRFVRAMITHRRLREASILNRVREGDRLISAMVPRVYEGLAPQLHGAAALSTFAHLEDLVARGLVRAPEGPPTLKGVFEPV